MLQALSNRTIDDLASIDQIIELLSKGWVQNTETAQWDDTHRKLLPTSSLSATHFCIAGAFRHIMGRLSTHMWYKLSEFLDKDPIAFNDKVDQTQENVVNALRAFRSHYAALS